MKIEITESKGRNRFFKGVCKVRVGPLGRLDPDSELHIVKQTGPDPDKDWEKVHRELVQGKKTFTFPDFEPGNYHVMVIGDKVAGVATTGGHDMPFPFNVFIDPPEEHAKDFLRLDIPAGKPLYGRLAQMVKDSFKEKGNGRQPNKGKH